MTTIKLTVSSESEIIYSLYT